MRTLEAVEHKCENPGTTRPVLKEGRTPEVECDLLEEFSCHLQTQELAGNRLVCVEEKCVYRWPWLQEWDKYQSTIRYV